MNQLPHSKYLDRKNQGICPRPSACEANAQSTRSSTPKDTYFPYFYSVLKPDFMNHILYLHAVSSSGRNVTVAVICLMTALIPLLMSSELFCLGLLKKEMDKNVAVTFTNIFMQKNKNKNKKQNDRI